MIRTPALGPWLAGANPARAARPSRVWLRPGVFSSRFAFCSVMTRGIANRIPSNGAIPHRRTEAVHFHRFYRRPGHVLALRTATRCNALRRRCRRVDVLHFPAACPGPSGRVRISLARAGCCCWARHAMPSGMITAYFFDTMSALYVGLWVPGLRATIGVGA